MCLRLLMFELNGQQVLHDVHEIHSYCIKTNDDIESKSFQDSETKLDSTCYTASVDMSGLDYEMLGNALARVRCCEVHSLWWAGYKVILEYGSVGVEESVGHIVAW